MEGTDGEGMDGEAASEGRADVWKYQDVVVQKTKDVV